jgi:hypothetical protein
MDLETVFYVEVEELVKISNNTYMDCIIHWCDKRNLEVEYVTGFIHKNVSLKSKIQAEAENLNFLKRTRRLPI